MNLTEFKATADAVADVPFDADRLLAGVYRRHTRRTRIRRAAVALPVAAVLTVAAISVPAVLGSHPEPPPLAVVPPTPAPSSSSAAPAPSAAPTSPIPAPDPADRTATAALAAFTFGAVTADGAPLVTVAGVELHYLPDGASPEVAGVEESVSSAADGSGDQVTYRPVWRGENPLGLSVTRAPGLTMEAYLAKNWFGGAEETTVNGRPALVNTVDVDGASGLLFSPEDGVVIELHLAAGAGDELRRIVEHMSL